MKLRHLLPTLLCAALLGSTATSRAESVNLFWGGADGLHTTTAALETDPLWQHAFSASHLDVDLEASLGHSIAAQTDTNHGLWHAGLTPMFHWWFTPNDALEAGIGANLFDGTRIAGKTISTAFQFGDSLGVEHRFGNSPWLAGLRFTHYSNGAIKHPNPGQNYVLMHIGYAFH